MPDRVFFQLDGVFRALEPDLDIINERRKTSIGSRFGLRSRRSEWFHVYRVGFTLFLPFLYTVKHFCY